MILFETIYAPYFLDRKDSVANYFPRRYFDYVDWGVERMFEQLVYTSTTLRYNYIKTL